jgi:hypothetical protein
LLLRSSTTSLRARRHDVEQEGIDADDGDQRPLGIDIAHDAERVAAELLDPEQAQSGITGRQHLRATKPGLVEFEGFRIRGADDRAVVIDQTHVLHRGALVDMETEGLQRRRIAVEAAAARDLVDTRRAEVDRDLGSAQRDVGQFMQPLLLLAFDDGLRDKMAAGRKGGYADNDGRNGRQARTAELHWTRGR